MKTVTRGQTPANSASPRKRGLRLNWTQIIVQTLITAGVIAVPAVTGWFALQGTMLENARSSANDKVDEVVPQKVENEIGRLILPIGTIIPYAGNDTTLPDGWRPCNGDIIDINQHPEFRRLHEIVMLTELWIDDHTLRLPDLRGRIPLGQKRASDNLNHDSGMLDMITPKEIGSWGGAEKGTYAHYHFWIKPTQATAGNHRRLSLEPNGANGVPHTRRGDDLEEQVVTDNPLQTRGFITWTDVPERSMNAWGRYDFEEDRKFNIMQPYFTVNYIIKYR